MQSEALLWCGVFMQSEALLRCGVFMQSEALLGCYFMGGIWFGVCWRSVSVWL